jgi:hypothetical protein
MGSRNELTICGERHDLEELLRRVEERIDKDDDWKREFEVERRLDQVTAHRSHSFPFSCSAKGSRPAVILLLSTKGPNKLYVSTIVPLEKRELTEDKYNIILAEFQSRFLSPASAGMEVEVKLATKRVMLEQYLSLDATTRLRTFAASANRTILQASDRKRWKDFIVQLHLDGTVLDTAMLDAWLQENGWSEDSRRELVSEYEAARSLLAAYDEERHEKCLP